MTKKEICLQYIALLEKGEIDKLLTLFNKDGVVDSPIYGLKLAANFYRDLTSDTNNSELKLLGIFEESVSDTAALYFNYQWTLKSNEVVNFDVVDIIEFDTQNKISKLKIIYDTVVARDLVKQLDA